MISQVLFSLVLIFMGQQRQLIAERQGVVFRKGAVDDKIKLNIDNRAKFTASLGYAHAE
jgi:structural maintenance of chromosomes protein 5